MPNPLARAAIGSLLSVVVIAGCDRSTVNSESTRQADAEKPAVTESAPSLPRTPAPEGARVFIAEPADGAVVSSPFTVVFGAENLTIVPAGTESSEGGHHHLLVDAPLPDNLGLPIINNDSYRHFGGGQTRVELELAPGEHTLQLLLGDHLHVPHDPPIQSDVITVTVE
ncbi:MAG: DUF4399 domain-containing protein [Pseudomonadota bacterium]